MMDLAYVCEWEKRPKSNHCPSIPLVCAWSCRNLIAFTTDLKNEEEKDLTHMIHILDTEHPWDVYSINSEHNEMITCLEWDQSGSRLLSADADGHVKCWGMSDHLANSWENTVGSMVEGDPIVSLSWLHNGVKLALHVEKSGASSFGDKFSRVKFSPSLTLFGGKPMEGWIAVTISGLVTVSLLKPNGQVLTSTESLCRLRCRVALADVAFTGGGNIVVATSDGSSTSPVQFYKVCVSVVNEKCRIDTEILPSLFMRCTTDPARKDKYPAITHLKFLARDMSEQVLLCASNQMNSIVECWSLRKEGLPVNNIFQQISPVVGDKQPMILKWRILSATNDLDRVSAVALPKLPISLTNTDLKVASDTKFCPGLDEEIEALENGNNVPKVITSFWPRSPNHSTSAASGTPPKNQIKFSVCWMEPQEKKKEILVGRIGACAGAASVRASQTWPLQRQCQVWHWPFTMAASTSSIDSLCRRWPCSMALPPSAPWTNRPSKGSGPPAPPSTLKLCNSPGPHWRL